jgi:hypothetical protein
MGFIASLFGGGKKAPEAPKPAPLPTPPTPDTAADKADENMKKKKATMAAGSRSVYSSPLGAAGTADVARKSLLGQ